MVTKLQPVKGFYKEFPAVKTRLTAVPFTPSASGETTPAAQSLAEKSISLDPKSTAKARGKRLRTVRMMTGLTRRALEEKYRISASTIQAWEAAKAGGLTERGVVRTLAMLKEEGITCTAEWLLYGIGASPQQNNQASLLVQKQQEAESDVLQDKLITQELLVFRSLHFDAADLVVWDDGMEPKFRAGDYIAGIYRSGDAIESTVGLDCIVQTADGSTVFRRVKKSNQAGLYNLVCINPDTTVVDTTLYDQVLVSVAPVVWHRRSDAAVTAAIEN